MNPTALSMLAQHIRLLVLDVDGVMTEGKIYVDPTQESLKAYHVHDGLGIQWLQRYHITVAIITGKASEMVTVRAKTLGIQHVFQNQKQKRATLETLLNTLQISPAQTAYMGDDLPDLAPMEWVGLPIAVANAHPLIQSTARWITHASGGNGAIREVAEYLLTSQGHWDHLVASYR